MADEVFDDTAAVVRSAPEDDAAWDRLEDFAANNQQPDEVAALYREVLGQELSGDVAPQVAQRAVQFHEEWFGEDSPLLVECLTRVLEVDPTASVWAFQRLTVVHTVAERWDDLLALYDREIERCADTHRKANLLEEAAQTAKDFAGRQDRAVDYLLQLLDLRPKDRALASSLERLLERQERWQDLVGLWRRQTLDASDEDTRSLRLRIAETLFEKLRQPGDAIGELQELLTHGGSAVSGTVAMLERIARDEEAPADARRSALSLLRERYDAENRHSDVLGTLETALSLADPSERVGLHRDAAQRMSDSDPTGALEHVGAVLRIEPASVETFDRALELARRAEAIPRFVELVLLAAAEAPETRDRARLRMAAAAFLVDLGELDPAIEQLEAVLAEPDLDADASKAAARRLADLLGRVERPQERLDVLERIAQLETDKTERREALAEAARLAAALDHVDRALGSWEQVLVTDSKDFFALEEIIALLDEQGRHGELVQALRRRAESGVPPYQRRSDLSRMATVQAGPLDAVDEAIASWNEIGASYGETSEVVDSLVDLYGRAERWEERAQVLERASQREDAHLAELRASQGDTFAGALDRPQDAVRAYRRALEADVRHERARQGLAQLAELESTRAEAVEALAKSYESTGEWEPLLALLDVRLGVAGTDARRVELLTQAADLQEHRAESAGTALGSVARAFALASADERLEARVNSLAEATADADAAADAFRAAAEAAQDPERSVSLRQREANLREEHLEDASGAFDAMIAALGKRPLRADLAAKVARLGEATERLEEAEASLRAASAHPHTPVEVLTHLAGVQREAGSSELVGTLERLAAAKPADLDALREIADLRAEGEDARRRLESLHRRASGLWSTSRDASGERQPEGETRFAAEQLLADHLTDASELVPFLIALARLPYEPAEQASHLRSAAEKAIEAGDRARATGLYREVLERDPEDASALRALGNLYAEQERHAELLGLRRRELEATEDPDRRIELRLEVANLVTEVERRGGRIDALRANLRERPGHDASLDTLEAILHERRDNEALADLFAQQAELLDGERSAALWGRVAELAEGTLSDVDRALEAHRRVVDVAPEDLTALDALARIQRERGEHAAAARWLERRLSVASNHERADVALELARSLFAAGRSERAAEVLEQARYDDPTRDDLRFVLAEHYRNEQQYEPLARVLADSAEHAANAADVLRFARESAELFRDRIGQPAEAIPILRKARQHAPDDRNLQLMLAEGLRDGGELDEAREILSAVIEGFGRRRSAERAQVHSMLGAVARAQGDLDGALEQLENATKMAMADAKLLQMSARLAVEAGQHDRAEKSFRALLMSVRRRGPKDEVDVGSAEVLYELSALAAARDDQEQADDLRESALEAAASEDAEAFRFRDALVERNERELALVALERRLALTDGDRSKAAILERMGDDLEALGRLQEAMKRRLESIEADPSVAKVHDAIQRMVNDGFEVDAYASVLERLIEAHRREEDAKLQARLLVRLGELRESRGDLDAATSLYGRAESVADEPVTAWVALARVGAARDDQGLQRRVLRELIAVEKLKESTRADALHQLAAILLRDPAALEEAVEIARQAFDADPRHVDIASHLDVAVSRSSGSIRPPSGEGEQTRVSHRPPPMGHTEAMRLYEEIARDAGDDHLLLSFLERRAFRVEATLPQVREGVERARSLLPQPPTGEAEDGAEELVVADPIDPARLDALLRRAVDVAVYSDEGPIAGRWALEALAARRFEEGNAERAMELMQKVIATAEHDEEKRELELRLAEMAAAPGGDLEVAAELYQGLLEPDPMDESIWRPLLSVLRRRGDGDRLNDLVVTLVDGLLDPQLRNEARMEQAEWLMGTEGREFDAVDVLKAILDEDQENQDAAQKLASLYERSGYDEDLVELYQSQLDIARDNEDLGTIAELSIKLGQLLEKVEREDALDVYRRALDWVSGDRGVISAYLQLLREEDDPRERAHVREKLLGIETGESASGLARELFEDWQQLEEPEGMTRALRLGYQGNPGDEEIRERLESRYRELEEWEPLADYLGMEAVRLKDDQTASIAKLREAAALQRDRLDNPAAAVQMLRQAREATGSVEILGELVAALQAAGEQEQAIEEVGSALEGHDTEDETYAHLLRSRAILRLGMSRVSDAIEDLEAAYAIAPRAVHGDLVAALRRARDASQGDARRPHVMRVVEVLEAAGDREEARAELASWSEQAPEDREVLERLRDIDQVAENWGGVANAAARLLPLTEGEEQVRMAILLADSCEAAGMGPEARSGLEYVHGLQPESVDVRERLKALYDATGANRELTHLLLQEASMVAESDPERAFTLSREAGKILIERENDPEAALPALAQAAQAKPDDHETLVLLADGYIGAQYFSEAGELLEHAIENHPKRRSPELSELQERMANLALAAGDRNLEMQWLDAAIESDKNNMSAAARVARIAYDLGELDVALGALRAVTLSKEDGPMSKAQAFLMQARIAHQRGEGRRALLWARKAKSEDPSLAEAQEFLADLGEG